jgi:hypothetical protein
MVFLGQRYWTVERPALALVRSMTKGKQLADRVAAFDDSDAIVAFLKHVNSINDANWPPNDQG